MLRMFALSAALLGLAVGQAQAQYYPQQGGGYPPPGPGPGYPPPPPPREFAYGPPGGQCDAFFRTPYGPRRFVCPMGRPKPVGAPCVCPPGDGYGPPGHGHVIP
jgi:hypothetical protein